MAKTYLHKQTITIAIVCILAVGGTAAYVYSEPAPVQPQNVAVEDTQVNTNIISASSTDWQKQFFDTTGGAKVITGGQTQAQTASDTPLTLTDKLGRDFFARFIELKQNNLDTNPQLVQGMIDQALANTEVAGVQAKVYTDKDVVVLNNSSAEAVRTYVNAIALISKKYPLENGSADIALSAFEKNNMNLLAQIDPIISNFKKTSEALVATPVPSALLQYHLSLINSVNSMAVISQSLRNIEGDPVQSIVSLGNYANTQTTIIATLLGIQSYLNTNHITFTQNEPGILFSQLKLQSQ